MSYTQNKTIARRFVEDIFNSKKTELSENYVTPDIIYHGVAEEVKGLEEFPREQWPQFVPLVYFSYHIMAGLGTIFIIVMALALFFLWRRTLFTKRWLLWAIMLAMPFPFIANTLGWVTAEAGRQPWIIYGLMRTADGSSQNVSSGNVSFTLLGFMGLYLLLALLYFALLLKIIGAGPSTQAVEQEREPALEGAR